MKPANQIVLTIAFNAIDIDKNGQGIYHGCYNRTFPNHIVITKADDTLGVIWEKTYSYPSRYLEATYLFATNDGGCIVTGGTHDNASSRLDLFVLKINADGTVGTDEILVQEIRPYAYWPNPAQDELHLQFSPDVTPKTIELYDLQGRLVRTQRNGLESLHLQGLSAGQFVMKVTLENGKVFSDKVVQVVSTPAFHIMASR